MGLAHSPRIVTDGLVLCLDAANSKGYDRFENLALNSEAINSWANNGNAILVTANSQIAPDGTLTADTLAQTAVTGASRWVSSTTRTYTAGITYTLSIWLKKISGTQAQPTINLWVNGGTNQSVGTITTEWIRYSKSFTPSSTISSNTFSGLNIGWSDSGGANDFVFAAWGFQIEIGSSATDYYRTTSTIKSRGTIWRDLSGNSRNFTLNNTSYCSFDSTSGSIKFARTLSPTTETGGYAEHIGSGDLLSSNYLYNNHTTEIWAKINNRNPTNYSATENASALFVYRGYHSMFYYSSSNLNYVIWNTSPTTLQAPQLSIGTSSTDIIQGQWFHALVVREGNTMNTYINGKSKGISSFAQPSYPSAVSNEIRIAMAYPSGSDYSWHADCDVGIVRMYTRAMNSTEVLQNFNATRGRYGI